MASAIRWSYEGKDGKEHYICTMDHGGPGEPDHRLPQKDETKVTTLVSKRARESHDLLSNHHRADEKGAHIPVGDIS